MEQPEADDISLIPEGNETKVNQDRRQLHTKVWTYTCMSDRPFRISKIKLQVKFQTNKYLS